MTKIDWNNFPIIPDFDVLKWKAETQAEIYQEIKDMTTEERLAYFRKGSEEFQEEQRLRRVGREK